MFIFSYNKSRKISLSCNTSWYILHIYFHQFAWLSFRADIFVCDFSNTILLQVALRLLAQYLTKTCRYALCFRKTFFKYVPVYDLSLLAMSSGVPFATKFPPPSPPSGPMSKIWSDDLITSMLCSMTRTVLPLSTNFCKISINFLTSS